MADSHQRATVDRCAFLLDAEVWGVADTPAAAELAAVAELDRLEVPEEEHRIGEGFSVSVSVRCPAGRERDALGALDLLTREERGTR